MSESHRRNLFLALCALVLLHTGVHLSQSFINYPGWYVLEAESFKAYHYPMSIRAGIFGAAPRLLELVLALVVLRFPHMPSRAGFCWSALPSPLAPSCRRLSSHVRSMPSSTFKVIHRSSCRA